MVRGTFQPPRYIPCLAHQEKSYRIFRYTQRKCMCIKSERTDGGSKTLMHVFDRFEDMDLITELLKGMYTELHEKKPNKAK